MITDYTTLKDAVAAWLHRTDLTAQIPVLIQMAESYLNRVLRTNHQVSQSALTLDTADRFTDSPARIAEVLKLSISGVEIIQSLSQDVSTIAETTSAGRPVYFAYSSQFEFDRIPDQAYSAALTYIKSLDIAADSTNWLIESHPDAYLFATLAEAQRLIINDPRIPMYLQKRDEVIGAINDQGLRNKRSVLMTEFSRPSFNIVTGV